MSFHQVDGMNERNEDQNVRYGPYSPQRPNPVPVYPHAVQPTYVLQGTSSLYNPNLLNQRTVETGNIDLKPTVVEGCNDVMINTDHHQPQNMDQPRPTTTTMLELNTSNYQDIEEDVSDDDINFIPERKSLEQLLEKHPIELFKEGFTYDLVSKFIFFSKDLYAYVVPETVIYYLIVTPWGIFFSASFVMFFLSSLWKYSPIIGAVLQLFAFLLFMLWIFLGPLFSNAYVKLSERTEEIFTMERNETKSSFSAFRCSPKCYFVSLLITVTYFLETIVLFIPISAMCVLCLICFPIGIPLLSYFQAFFRVWEAFRVVLIRKKGIIGYLELYKLFFFNVRLFPFLMGIGYGYCCQGRRRGCQRYYAVVSATRFYWEYLEEEDDDNEVIQENEVGGELNESDDDDDDDDEIVLENVRVAVPIDEEEMGEQEMVNVPTNQEDELEENEDEEKMEQSHQDISLSDGLDQD